MSKGKVIRKLREAANMSQVELAERIHVSKQTLYKYENDIITNIPSDKIEAIATVFGTEPGVIMGCNVADDAAQRNRLMAYCEKLYRLTPEHQIAVTSMIDFLTAEEEKDK